MDVYIYQEQPQSGNLKPIAELADFESVEEAFDALVDAEPKFVGKSFVFFTEPLNRVKVGPPPELPTKYTYEFDDNANGSEPEDEEPEDETEEEPEAEEEPEPEEEDEEPEEAEEEEEEAPRRRRPAAKKKGSQRRGRAAKKRSSRKPPAKRSASKAGTRTGAGKRTPFTKNPASAE
jgi:outer membrane biosynthesis protein TonB